MSRYIIEDEDGNRSYLPVCEGSCEQGKSNCRQPAACRERHTRVQDVIWGALGVMLLIWIALLVVRGIVDWLTA